jgi:hypothetical protein
MNYLAHPPQLCYMFRPTVATLALGLQPRQRACKVVGQEGSLGVTLHTFRSVGKCEGVNPHTPKVTPTSRDGVPMDSQIFKGQL